MPAPATALVWFLALAALVAVVAWPGRGLLARVARWRRLTERVRIEDALKHLLNCELAEQPATTASLAGILEISPTKAYALAERLGSLGLAGFVDGAIGLTEQGRAYALRILRTHRLLERYFADRTGAAPVEWHDLAETAEHGLTEAEVDALAARMGDPVYDPHGDPIPTAAGDLPPRRGLPLSALGPGETAAVIHVEDEPAPVYRRLLSLGIDRAVPIKMLRSDADGIEVLVGGVTRRLDPLAAAAVSVDRVAEAAGHTVLFERLDGLQAGEVARVVEIAPTVQGPQRRRLLDLGVLPGTEITAEFRSPSGDPMAFRIRGALIALRQPQAHGIYIQRAPTRETAGAS
ncbi:MAG: metal-dependent transcriptional regulator [Gemmatimonadetes bacterium]|nr:metal-dependent transcriptional regulator [Gemmatimonadota bacterium]